MKRADLRALQNQRLQRYVREYLYPFSSYYREQFDKAGIKPDQIKTVDDLKHLPLSSKADLLPTEDDPQQFKRFILKPDAKALYVNIDRRG